MPQTHLLVEGKVGKAENFTSATVFVSKSRPESTRGVAAKFGNTTLVKPSRKDA